MTESHHLPPDPPREPPPEREGIGERIEHAVEAVGEAVGRVEEKVEHAAEEVAEGVAGHVPEPIKEPVRWTVQKLILVSALAAVVLALLLVVGVSYYVWNHTEWASHELTWRVNRVLRAHSDVELSLSGVRGNPLSRVEVLAPRVRFRDGTGPPLLEARSMILRYSTWNLFTGKRGALVIEVDRPVLRLARRPDGRLRAPLWRTGPGPRRPGRGFDYVLRIRDGDLILPEAERSIEDFHLEAAVATGEATSAEIRSLSWKRGFHGLALHRLHGTVSAADSLILRIDRLEASDLALTAGARWKRGQGSRLVEARVARVRWSWLARVFRNRTLDVPGEGAFWIQAREEGGWTGSGRTRARWNGLPLEAEASFAWRGDRLTLDPLRGRSPAGALSEGRLHWSKQGWDVTGTATGADPSRWDVIGLQGWPAGDLNGRLRYAVDTRRQPDAGLDAWLGPSQWAGWRADSATVRVEFPPGAPDSFQVAALRRGGRMELSGRVKPGGWSGRYRIADLPLDEWPDGRAGGLLGTLGAAAGTVEARAGALWVTGALEGRSTRWFGIEAGAWRLDEVRGRLLPAPELEARTRLRDAFYLGVHFDSAAAPLRLGDGRLELPSLGARAADTVVTMTLGVEWQRDGWRLTADGARARSRSFDWAAEEPIRMAGDPRGVTFERLALRDGESRLEIGGRWAAPGGRYDWRASARALRLERLGLPAELGLSGTADAELEVSGPAGDPSWRLAARVGAPSAQGRTLDSLRAALAGERGGLEVRELALRLGDGWLEASGQVGDTARPWPDTLTPAGVAAWLATADRWSGRVRARELPLDRATRLLGAGPGWTGRMEGTLDVAGRPRQPELELALRVRPLAWKSVELDDASARAAYRAGRLRLERLRATRQAQASEVTGEMEIRLALGERPRLLDAPMRWELSLPDGDLGLLPLLVPQIGYAAGRFHLQGEIRGTPRRPQLSGTARVQDGRLRIAGREEVMEDVGAELRFEGPRMVLESFRAAQRTREAAPGRVAARGAVELGEGRAPSYRFDVAMRDFTALETGLYAARFDGDFVIADGATVGGQTLPHVTSDNVEIERAVILYDFAGQSETQQVEASTQPLYWTYRIRLHATDNLRWQPPDGDIQFSADLNLEQTPDQLVIFGDMEALRGSYWFLDNRFTVRRANLTFDNVRGVDPLVDAEAVTRLRPSFVPVAESDKIPGPYDITVRIQGRASVPQVVFESVPSDPADPILDEAQILRELTVGRFVEGGGPRVDPFESYLTRVLSRQLSQELSRAFRGYLSDWEIARESGAGLILGVGSQLNDRLALRYRQLVPGTAQAAPTPGATLVERDLEAEYRINRFFYVTSQLTQKRSTAGAASVSPTPDFNINLKARWEY